MNIFRLSRPKFLVLVFCSISAISYLLNWTIDVGYVLPSVTPWAIIFGPYLYVYLEHPSLLDYVCIATVTAIPILVFLKDNLATRVAFVIGAVLWFLSGCGEVWKGF